MPGTATTEQAARGRGVSFELTQALLSAGGVYQVRRRRDDAVAFTVRGVSGAATPASGPMQPRFAAFTRSPRRWSPL